MSLGRILIVDDEADIRRTVKFALTKAGYEVKEAENGEEAIKRNPKWGQSYQGRYHCL